MKMFLKDRLGFIDICAIFDEDVNLIIAEFLISHTLQMFIVDIHLQAVQSESFLKNLTFLTK